MSWDALSLVAPPGPARPRIERSARPLRRGATTFYEVAAKTIIEAAPDGWAVSPYRGCASACLYCSARRGHRYLGLDPLADFGSRIVVKTNAARRLRAELPRFVRDHPGEAIQLGQTGDCYQPAEEVYRLMPGVIAALRDHAVPFTVLTRSTGVLRDLDLLAAAAEVSEVTAQVSVGFVDDRIRRALEPDGPSPQQRLELCARLGEAGVPCGVVMAPILPCLTDSPDQLRAAVRRIAGSGAVEVTPVVLRLPSGARQPYLDWLAAAHPGLVARYAELYAGGAEAAASYQERVTAEVRQLAAVYGIGRSRTAWRARRENDRQLALTLDES
ncbi:radical SAM protein [Streptosporangiaceae bacterium NEAU-GS5]|nr:radical SAM protein [Streptosporangiaceae bacterium NEAU-GS5]